MRHGLPLALFVVLMLTTWALTALVIFGAMRLVRTRRVAYRRVLLFVVAIQLATLTLVAIGLRFGSLDAAAAGRWRAVAAGIPDWDSLAGKSIMEADAACEPPDLRRRERGGMGVGCSSPHMCCTDIAESPWP